MAISKKAHERRTYDQECGLAFALDVVGERWTLLIVRELLTQPRRYKELLDSLPGIGTNLLADRLGALTEAKLIESTDPGRRTAAYQLTPLGRMLHEPVLGLARFGLAIAAEESRPAAATVRASWAALAIEAMIDRERVPDIGESYQFDIDGEVFHIAVSDGQAHTLVGPAPDPTLTVSTDANTFFDLGMRRLDPMEAVVSGAVQVNGSASAMPRCLRLIGLANDPPAATPRTRRIPAGTH